jgi:hypothetical protein
VRPGRSKPSNDEGWRAERGRGKEANERKAWEYTDEDWNTSPPLS